MDEIKVSSDFNRCNIMNILFVLYGDLSSNSAIPLALYAREFVKQGHSCTVAIPGNLESIHEHNNPFFRAKLYSDALNNPERIFPDGRPADIIHAWTPRENVRRFVTSYMAKHPTPLLVYLEDHEWWISCRALGLEEETLVQQTEESISKKLPDSLSHPFRYNSFIGLADAVAVIQDKLKIDVPPWVNGETVMPGVDIEFFSPRVANPALRKQYGIRENEKVIVYPGGLNEYTKPSIETLCRAVGLINLQGVPCRLLRTGPYALDFIDQLPPEAAAAITDLGVLPRNALPDLFALADIFVQPGKIDPFEDLRLPGKLPELLAMGRPVVLPGVNIAHLFRDGIDAVLTQIGSAEEIATKCMSLFSDPLQAGRIGQEGRKFAEKYFAIEEQSKRMVGAYITACENFDPVISMSVWRGADENTPVTALLARKLELMADSKSAKFDIKSGAILKEHARYLELMQLRVEGLEKGVAERDRMLSVIQAFRIGFVIRALHSITLQIGSIRRIVRLTASAIKRVGGLKNAIAKAIALYRRERLSGVRRIFKLVDMSDQVYPYNKNDYDEWIRRYDTVTDEMRASMCARIEHFSHRPLISVVMPTYNPKPEWLIEAIESVRRQIYPHWELCIADDASTDNAIRPILERYAKDDSRIKVTFREKNGHISAASNSALELVTGKWIALLDHDDLLSEHALFLVAEAANLDRDVRMIYSAEDKIDEMGNRFSPYFKCKWNIDLFYSQNMFSHLGVYYADVVSEVGGFREGLEGSQDYDLALRCIERIKPEQIYHIPRVLYHWRVHAASTAQSSGTKPYAVVAGERALNEHFMRIKTNAKAESIGYGYRVRYALPAKPPLVSLIIQTGNGLQFIRQCVASIVSKTTYQSYEILIIDNGSDDPATKQYFDELRSQERVKVIRDDRPSKYSALNNAVVKFARGDLIGLLSNQLDIISPDWLSEMVSIALQQNVGAVGAKLVYPDETVQHVGIILGLGSSRVAGHAFYRLPERHPGYWGRAILSSSFSAVSADCLIVRKSIYEEIGGMNETDLNIAFNDVDFCLRLQVAGYRNVLTPHARLYHHESVTLGFEDIPEKLAHCAKEIAYMKQRWGDLLLDDPAYSPNLTLDQDDFSLAWPPRVQTVTSVETE